MNVLQRGLKHLGDISKLHALDPVGAPPQSAAAIKGALL